MKIISDLDKNKTKVVVFCDGASRGNPGSAAIGIFILDEDENTLKKFKECIGVTTNNVAEYSALIKALNLAAKHTNKEVHIFMDSELFIKQLNGQYRVKTDHIQELYKKVRDNEKFFKKVVYNNVPRENKNLQIAD